MKLIKYPNPILLTKLPLIEEVNDEHREIAELMLKIMYEHNGVGLAANQIDYPYQIFVIRPDKVFINPSILMTKGLRYGSEGCLSMPGLRQRKGRYTSLKLRYTTLKNETIGERFTDLEARIIQHEVDHLNGILCLDPSGIIND